VSGELIPDAVPRWAGPVTAGLAALSVLVWGVWGENESGFTSSVTRGAAADGFGGVSGVYFDSKVWGGYEQGDVTLTLQVPKELGGCVISGLGAEVEVSDNVATDVGPYTLEMDGTSVTAATLATLANRVPQGLCTKPQ
jgi:hypothetical protein